MFEYFDIDLTKASFEWDEEKEKMIREDKEHPEELRYDILGRVGKILFVVCAFRDQNVIRMISARLATTSEKERYEHGEDDYE